MGPGARTHSFRSHMGPEECKTLGQVIPGDTVATQFPQGKTMGSYKILSQVLAFFYSPVQLLLLNIS